MQATNATARAELCYSRSLGKQRTLQLGLNYVTLVWHHPALSLQATSTYIFPACTNMWPLEKSWKVSKIGLVKQTYSQGRSQTSVYQSRHVFISFTSVLRAVARSIMILYHYSYIERVTLHTRRKKSLQESL